MAQSIVGGIVGLLGLHMLWAAARRRTPAEAFIGLFFVSSAVGSETGLRAITGAHDRLVAEQLLLLGVIAFVVSSASAYAFIYTVFRRGEEWALAIVVLGTAFVVWGAWTQLGAGSGPPDLSGLRVEFLAARFVSFAWGTYEALRAYRMAKRRLSLGLADPIVVNRFLLFGIWFGVMGVLPLILAYARLSRGAATQLVAVAMAPKIIGVIMIASLVLTFFPPRKYLSWVVASAPEAT